MSQTDGRYTQDTPVPDMQVFVGASEFVDTSAHVTVGSAGAGLFSQNLAAALAATLFADVTALLKRTGVFATPAYDQEQYGTAASVPGPTTVANTTGPEGITGFPPFLAAALPTLKGPVSGAVPKGVQITGIDVIYTVTGAALTVVTVGVTDTNFVNNVAPAVVNRIALGANGLPTAVQAQPYRTNVAVPTGNQAMATLSDTETIVNVNLTTQAGGSAVFYGVVLYVQYNFN